MDAAPFTACAVMVAKVSSGHVPPPFLISYLKNWCKDRAEKLTTKFIFLQNQ